MGTAACFAGIDVSKDTLDACLLLPGGKAKEHAFGNDPRGHAALLAWADRHAAGAAVHFCMEATGPYSEAPSVFLADAGRHVSVVNPTRVKYAGLARGRGNKTDRADALLVAEYAARERPPAWRPVPGGWLRTRVRMKQFHTRRRENSRDLCVLPPLLPGSAGVSPARRRRSQASNLILGAGGSDCPTFPTAKVSLVTSAATKERRF